MKHGVRFIIEHPQMGELLKKLYKTRELDDWYKETCKSKIELPKGLMDYNGILKCNVVDRYSPSANIYFELKKVSGENGFVLKQEIHLRVSKLLRVYHLSCSYTLKSDYLTPELDLWGPPQTDGIIEAEQFINDVLSNEGYIELNNLYDIHDTVFEWTELSDIDVVNRRLTLEDAVFTDVLELCNES